MKRTSLIVVCLVLILKISTTEQCKMSLMEKGLNYFLQTGTANTVHSENTTEIEELPPTLRERFPGLDPEAYMDAQELIESKGIPYEGHTAETDDGYLLGLKRLARPNSTQQYPVLLMHGLLSSCESYLLNRRDQSLAYILYDRGFDVWLGNVRGSKYSRNHTSLDPESKEFWDWSFDEIGRYDVPAMIDHVLEVTGKSKLNYVGHSQGAMVLFSAVIQNHWWYQATSEIAQKIDNFIALAPAVYIEHAFVPFAKDVLYAVDIVIEKLKGVYRLTKNKMYHDEFAPKLSDFTINFCSAHPFLCRSTIDSMSGLSRGFNLTRLGVYLLHWPSATSKKNMRHWNQMARRSNNKTGMNYYDYEDGWTNMVRYRQLSMAVPEYDFNRFLGVKTHIYCGENDLMVTASDCMRLKELVSPTDLQRAEVIDYFSHFDFAYSINANYMVYEGILRTFMGENYKWPPSPCLPNVYRPPEFDPSSCDDAAERRVIVNPTMKPRRKHRNHKHKHGRKNRDDRHSHRN